MRPITEACVSGSGKYKMMFLEANQSHIEVGIGSFRWGIWYSANRGFEFDLSFGRWDLTGSNRDYFPGEGIFWGKEDEGYGPLKYYRLQIWPLLIRMRVHPKSGRVVCEEDYDGSYEEEEALKEAQGRPFRQRTRVWG